MNHRILPALAALAAIAGAFLLYHSVQRAPRINLNPYAALGAITAEETSSLLGKRGSVVIVINDPGDEKDPVMDAQLAAFKTTLKKSGGVTVAAVETVKMDPFQRMSTGGALPADQFTKLLETHRSAAAFLFFIGFPALGESAIAKIKQTPVKFIVASACLPGYRELIRQRVFHLAIVPRVGDAPGGNPMTMREWFDQDYVLATPETADRLPY